MCEATTIALVAGMVLTAASGYHAADSAKKVGEYEQQVAEQNAERAEFQEAQARTIGSINEERARQRAQQMVGKQRAALASTGADLSSGTALDLVSETALFGEEDALMTRFNAMNEAWGYGAQATDYRNQGRAAKTRSKNEAMGTYLTTAGSLASQGSQLYGGANASKAAGKTAGKAVNKSAYGGMPSLGQLGY